MRVTMAAAGAALWMMGAGQALAQPAADAPSSAETRELLEAARATAKATRDTADSIRILPDQLHQILSKLDKLEDKLDKVENAIKAQNGRRGR